MKTISHLFNVTRIYVAVSSASAMRRYLTLSTSFDYDKRLLAMARDYANKREAFGKKLMNQPLHIVTLSRLETTYRGTLHFAFNLVKFLGESECENSLKATVCCLLFSLNIQSLLRILTPIAKLFLAKLTVGFASEALESFGGFGYMEDTGIPLALRESQVNTIWEGTTNVLSLDVLRVVAKQPDAMNILLKEIQDNITSKNAPSLLLAIQSVEKSLDEIKRYLYHVQTLISNPNFSQVIEAGKIVIIL